MIQVTMRQQALSTFSRMRYSLSVQSGERLRIFTQFPTWMTLQRTLNAILVYIPLLEATHSSGPSIEKYSWQRMVRDHRRLVGWYVCNVLNICVLEKAVDESQSAPPLTHISSIPLKYILFFPDS